jgi:AcrR family transcriptional regulator
MYRMAPPRQAPTSESSGRVNQKRRTRAVIVDTARAMLERGERPTIARVAEEALMSRPTVYRYFPTQESLLNELSVSLAVDEMEELLAAPQDGTPPEARLLEMIDRFTRHAAANEALYRSSVRHYMDIWLAAELAGEGHEEQLREGRRRRWIATALGPARDTIPAADLERLEAALCLVMGTEALIVLRDVCHLDDDDAVAVIHWAAEALLAAGFRS